MIGFRDSDNIFQFNEKKYCAERGIECKNLSELICWLKGAPLQELKEIANDLVEKEENSRRQTLLFDVISAIQNIEEIW